MVEGDVELHGMHGVLAIWPINERVPGKRYAG